MASGSRKGVGLNIVLESRPTKKVLIWSGSMARAGAYIFRHIHVYIVTHLLV